MAFAWPYYCCQLDLQSGVFHFLSTQPFHPTVNELHLQQVTPARIVWTGNLESEDLRETSGLAASTQHPNLFWAVNDGGSPAAVHAIDGKGRDLGSWQIDATNFDWEALAAFRYKKRAYLLIADTGDNLRWRQVLTLYVIEEPDISSPADTVLPVAWQIQFSYPQGYRDCEAVAVDSAGETLYLISKRTIPAEVWTLPIAPTSDVLQPTRVATLRYIPQPRLIDRRQDPANWRFRATPTGLDFAGDTAVVTTYADAFVFERQAGHSWAATFSGMPRRLQLPAMSGREAVAFFNNGRSLLLVAERFGTVASTPVFQVDL